MKINDRPLSRVDGPFVAERQGEPIQSYKQRNTLEVHIEKMVLDGFAAKDGALIQAAIERELARLLRSRRLLPRMVHDETYARLECGSIAHSSSLNSKSIGTRVAQRILRGMNDEPKKA